MRNKHALGRNFFFFGISLSFLVLSLLLFAVSVSATAPTQGTPILNSTAGTNLSYENLTVYNVTTADADGDTVKNYIDWQFGSANISRFIVYLEMDGGSTLNTTRDYSSFNHSISIYNTTFFNTTGPDGRGMYTFNTTPNHTYINITNANEFNLINDGYMACVETKPTSTSGGTIAHKRLMMQIAYATNNRWIVFVTNSTGQTVNLGTPSKAGYLNTWHWVCQAYNLTDTFLFVDKDLALINKTGSLSAPTHDLFLGMRATHDQPYNGSLSKFFLMNGSNMSFNDLWLVHNLTADNTTTILTNAVFREGETWNACVTPNDGGTDGPTTCSNQVAVVTNNVPTHGTPVLNTTFEGNNSDENLTVFNISTQDPDGNATKNIYNWYRNNLPVLLIHLPFEPFTNNSFTKDYSTTGTNGNVSGATHNFSGGYDSFGAYNFNGINNYIVQSNNESYLDLISNFSIEFWFRRQGKGQPSNGTEEIVGKGAGEPNGYAVTFNDTSSMIQIALNNLKFNSKGVFLNNTWYHIVMTVNDTNTSLYVDGTLNMTAAHGAVGLNDFNFTIGAVEVANGYSRFFNGTIDEVKLWNLSLNPTQIQLLYQNKTNVISLNQTNAGETWKVEITPTDKAVNGNDTTKVSNSILVNYLNISLTAPPNGSRESATNLQFAFNVTAGKSIICSLFDNDVGTYRNISSLSSIVQNGNNSITHNAILENNTILWNVECLSPAGTRFWQNLNFSLAVDRTAPIIAFTIPVRANTTPAQGPLFRLNMSCTDVGGLFEFQVNITNTTNQSIYLNLTTNITGTNFNFTPLINLSSNSSGIYQMNVQCSDDHTAEIIPDYATTIDEPGGELDFATDTTTNITIDLVSSDIAIENIETIRENDRYTFTYDFLTPTEEAQQSEISIPSNNEDAPPSEDANLLSANHTFIYQIRSTYPINYRNNSQYTAHFVTGHNWIDFEGVEGNFIIFQNQTGWYVRVDTTNAYQNFSSIGGLNIIQENLSFTYDLGFDIANTSNITFTPNPLRHNDLVKFNATFNVTGATNASSLNISLTVDNIYLDSTIVTIINGSSLAVSLNWTAQNGTHTIGLNADPANNIGEAFETNNNATITVYVFNANLTIYDQADSQGGSLAAEANNSINFTANYTSLLNASSIAAANCNITFNVTPFGPSVMAFDTPKQTYTFNRSFASDGNVTWNVSCIATGFDMQNTSNTIEIIDTTPPNVSSITPISLTAGNNIIFAATVLDGVGVSSCNLFVSGVNDGAMTLSGTNASRSKRLSDSGIVEMYANCTDLAGNRNFTRTNVTVNAVPAQPQETGAVTGNEGGNIPSGGAGAAATSTETSAQQAAAQAAAEESAAEESAQEETTETQPVEQFSSIEMETTAAAGDTITIAPVAGTSFVSSVTILAVTSTSATIIVSSLDTSGDILGASVVTGAFAAGMNKEIKMQIGDKDEIDMNSDGITDVLVILSAITFDELQEKYIASFTITYLHPTKAVVSFVHEQEKQEQQKKAQQEEQPKQLTQDTTLLFAVLFSSVALFFMLLYASYKSYKLKKLSSQSQIRKEKEVEEKVLPSPPFSLLGISTQNKNKSTKKRKNHQPLKKSKKHKLFKKYKAIKVIKRKKSIRKKKKFLKRKKKRR